MVRFDAAADETPGLMAVGQAGPAGADGLVAMPSAGCVPGVVLLAQPAASVTTAAASTAVVAIVLFIALRPSLRC
jgi:hypothetical protein